MSQGPLPSAPMEQAPARFTVVLETTKGAMEIDVAREDAPLGADRFYNLVRLGFFTEVAFFRVVPGFVAQAGIHGDPQISKAWRDARIKDDPVRLGNAAGTVCFATSGAHARTTQLFINLRNNSRLDAMGFAAFGKLRDLKVAEQLCGDYGEGPPGGQGPQQSRVQREGNQYLRADFPGLDYILRARVL